MAGLNAKICMNNCKILCGGGGLVTKSCLTLCDPMDCSPPVSSIRGIFQTRILEWIAISFSRGSSRTRDWSQVSCTAGIFFTGCATKDGKLLLTPIIYSSSHTFSHQVTVKILKKESGRSSMIV